MTEIWITLAESPATKRIAELAHGSSDGRPVTGTCDIVVAPPSGAKPRQYLVDGCFPKSVDATGASRRVTLGYTAIKVSE